MCGNSLNESAEFCNICGTPTGVKKQNEAAAQKAQEELKNPTMDEIQIPVITDDTPGLQEVVLKDENTPTMDSIYMPGQEPVQAASPVQSAAPKPSPVITAEEQALASRTVTVGATPTISDTPNVSDMYSAGGTAQNQESILTPEGQRVPVQNTAGGAMPMGSNAIPGGMPAGAGNVMPNGMPQTPHAVHRSDVVPGKGAGALVPIILAIAIVLVILFDVFFLFKDQIFGKDDKAKSDCAVVTVEDFMPEADDIIIES